MSYLRPFVLGDGPALDEVCVRTGADGGEATGLRADDRVLADVYLRPYLSRHPQFALIVCDDDDVPSGYVVAAPDTDVFEDWFRDEWWPSRAGRYDPLDDVVRGAADIGGSPSPWTPIAPAHLHINLLPRLQGEGWGRAPVTEELDALGRAGVTGVHLVVSGRNERAMAFYRRVGFQRIGVQVGAVVYAREIRPGAVSSR